MNFAMTVLADTWNGHHMSGWWFLLMVPMMVFMGGMMWMMMRGMMGRGSSSDSCDTPASVVGKENPMDALERRLAEGEISIEDYRARRDALIDGAAKPSGDEDAERLVAPGSRGGEP